MNVLMIHGIDTNEDANPNPYVAWSQAITAGLKGAGYANPISADPNSNGLRYNDIFDNHSDNPAVYAAAVTELVASWAVHTITGPFLSRAAIAPEQPGGDGLLAQVRWSAGMVAQWVAEDELRSDCRDLLFKTIQTINPDVIFAHSLGTLICYDLFVNDKRGATLFEDGVLVTFGSQIANPFVKDKMWDGKLPMINVKTWYNLNNPYDHVFVVPIGVTAPNYHQFIIEPPFGTGSVFNTEAHQATAGGGNNSNSFPGYLDNSTTNAHLWPALVPELTMASLIAAKINVMKHLTKPSAGTAQPARSRPPSSKKRKAKA